jgi:hypothetical protein
MPVTVKHNQTLIDISLQACGSVDRLIDVAILNNISMTTDLAVGTLLDTPLPAINTWRNAAFFKVPGNEPASGYSQSMQGIGVWIINVDFVVSTI